ncbi:MAG: alanine--glyoxylate aminotransferase family protein [Dehalococcoidia bacterium]|nr:alanine--glyoxylate aminotransferase family protein [Dehalococcoidia bacterium]MDW8120540.1 alanine--glyoxylate aminotransferase family protein [Chloroflexota bacterium]
MAQMAASVAPPLQVPQRLLLGPGPSNINPRVLRAMSAPALGYLDPTWMQTMDEIAAMLRALFRTRNDLCIAMPGTGTAGMETAIANLVEPGDVVVVGTHGFFGERLAEIARRYGATVATVPGEWGRPLDPDAVEAELRKHPKVKALGVVHAETSTGVLQPLEALSALARRYDCLLIVDAVTSLGGSPVEVDAWGIDFCYSASQKCLGCPPGLAPVTVSPRAEQAIARRTQKVRSFYLDLTLHRSYWGGPRLYHHTAPVNLLYGLHEGLRLILEEGLEARWERHRRVARALWAGLEALGLRLLVAEAHRTPQLTTVVLPEGVDEMKLRRTLLDEWGIEVGGGLGALRGKILRIGLMGENATPSAVLTLLCALEALLPRLGYEVPPGAGTAAAGRVLAGGG